MRITVTFPRVQASQLTSNLLGVLGLAGLVVTVGGLTGNWWWSVGLGSLIAVGLAWVANTHAQAAAAARTAPAAVEGVPGRLRVAGPAAPARPAGSPMAAAAEPPNSRSA